MEKYVFFRNGLIIVVLLGSCMVIGNGIFIFFIVGMEIIFFMYDKINVVLVLEEFIFIWVIYFMFFVGLMVVVVMLVILGIMVVVF